MTRDKANAIIDLIECYEERTNHQQIVADMNEKGYSEAEVDRALKALGAVAVRDFGWL